MTAFQTQSVFGLDGYVAKLSPQGAWLWGTYLGGSGLDIAAAVAVDSSGDVYVAGTTTSDDFPTTKNSFLPARPQPGSVSATGFVSKLKGDGSAFIYSTFLGGRAALFIRHLALDAGGNAYVVGDSFGADFPTRNALQSQYAGGDDDGFVAELTPAGAGLVFSTFLGGSNAENGCCGIALGADNSIYLAGH